MLNYQAFLLVIAKLKIRISGCFMLANNLLESTAGKTRVHLMSRSVLELILQRGGQPNAGPKNASTQKIRELDRERYLWRCN